MYFQANGLTVGNIALVFCEAEFGDQYLSTTGGRKWGLIHSLTHSLTGSNHGLNRLVTDIWEVL